VGVRLQRDTDLKRINRVCVKRLSRKQIAKKNGDIFFTSYERCTKCDHTVFIVSMRLCCYGCVMRGVHDFNEQKLAYYADEYEKFIARELPPYEFPPKITQPKKSPEFLQYEREYFAAYEKDCQRLVELHQDKLRKNREKKI